jgi:hypothetical protein
MRSQTFLIHFFQPILCFFGVACVIWTVQEPLYVLIPAAFILFESCQYWKRQKGKDQQVEVEAAKNGHDNNSDEVCIENNSGDKSTIHVNDWVLENYNEPEKASFDMNLISKLAYGDGSAS